MAVPLMNQPASMAAGETADGLAGRGAVAPVMSGTDSVSSRSPEALRSAPSLESASRPATAAGLLDMSAGMSTASGVSKPAGDEAAEPGSTARARGGKALSESSTEAEPNPRFLRLREVSDLEVAASLRDADLDRPDSQRAAQGLARALMEAGYSRVQVVVNGVSERQEVSERHTDSSEPRTDMTARRAAIRSNTSSTEAQHGD